MFKNVITFLILIAAIPMAALRQHSFAATQQSDQVAKIHRMMEQVEQAEGNSSARLELTVGLLKIAAEQPNEDVQFKALVVAANTYLIAKQPKKVSELLEQARAVLPEENCKEHRDILTGYEAYVDIFEPDYLNSIERSRQTI